MNLIDCKAKIVKIVVSQRAISLFNLIRAQSLTLDGLAGRVQIEEPTTSDIHRLFEAGQMSQIKKLVIKGQLLRSHGTVGLARALQSYNKPANSRPFVQHYWRHGEHCPGEANRRRKFSITSKLEIFFLRH